MKFHKTEAKVFVPDGMGEDAAVKRITHLSIGAHQDDTEIMSFHGVKCCLEDRTKRFGVVTCTNGAGSPRSGAYSSFTDAEMAALRRKEQEKAAVVGDYAALVQLNYSSAEVKGTARGQVRDDLISVLKACRPEIVYTHNPADKHDTHVAVCLAAVAAVRALEPGERPAHLYGCEVWRSLDWAEDSDKVALDTGGHDNIASAILGVYDSQIAGGKRYDTATLYRRKANGTYFQSHATDEAEELWFALDLTPLMNDPSLDPADLVLGYIDRFRKAVDDTIKKFSLGR